MILRPAQKIEVIKSNRQCKAGSIGYFVCQDPLLKYNAWQMAAVFTRYGKKGKRRISVLEFSTHMLDNSQLKGSDRKIIDIVKFVEKLDPRLDSTKRKSHKGYGTPAIYGVGGSIVKPIGIECKNLLNLDTWDFLGYITALSIYLNRLQHNKLSYQLVSMPLIIGWSEFVERKDVRLMSPDYMGYFIIQGLMHDAENKDKSFEDLYLDTFNDHAKRKECLDKIIMSMLMLKDRDAGYKSYILQVYNTMEANINEILSFYRKRKNDLKSVQKGEEEFKDNRFDSPLTSPRQQEALIKLSDKEKRIRHQFSTSGKKYIPYYPRREE